MAFDEEELDPHGECAAEINRLQSTLAERDASVAVLSEALSWVLKRNPERHGLESFNDGRRWELSEIQHYIAPIVASLPASASASLLRKPGPPDPGCYCEPGRCMAPVVMGRQMPCRDTAKRDAHLPSQDGE